MSFCTSIFGHRHSLSTEKLRQLAAAGAEWVEIAGLQEPHVNAFDDERIEELARAAREVGLKTWSWHASFCGIAMDDADTRAEGIRKIVQAARAAHKFGARIVVVHPGRDIPTVNRKRELRWTVDGLAAACDQMPRGMRLAMETMGEESLAGRAEEMLAVLDRLRGAPVGICFDSGHVNIVFEGGKARATPGKEPSLRPAQYARAVAGRIITVHFHDNYGNKDAHALPGKGNIDWPPLLRALREGGYDGVWMSEAGDEELSLRAFVKTFAQRMKAHCRTGSRV